MEAKEKRRIVEALILSSPEPISADKLAEIIPYCKAGQAKDLVNELNTEYAEQDRAFEIWEVAGGFQIRTRAEFSGYLQKLQKERALRLSPAALETLAIIAYRQPTTRAEIEDVRGVDAGATVRSLLERQLIRIAGQREVPGRPMLYGTTRRFLEVFGIENLKGLPSLRELDELAKEQGLLESTADESAKAASESVVDSPANSREDESEDSDSEIELEANADGEEISDETSDEVSADEVSELTGHADVADEDEDGDDEGVELRLVKDVEPADSEHELAAEADGEPTDEDSSGQ